MKTIYPLKPNWKINEDEGFVADQIKNRCDAEDNYTWGKNYQLTSYEDNVEPLAPRIKRI